ncbi:MAG: hypothetical protein MUE97_06860 [Phycisphaerales bacterium]|jgi:hypothetical protein|nr:hypothetical protein [Phycisphaerales bacterium]
MRTSLLVVVAGSAVMSGVGVAAAQPFLANIDPFTAGPLTVNLNIATPAFQNTQTGLIGVLANSRQNTLSAPVTTPAIVNAVAINTAGAGTLAINHVNSAVTGGRGSYIFNYGGPTAQPLGSPLVDFSFPGVHGVAIDFNSLSNSLPFEISLITGTNSGWRTTGTIVPQAGAFRFRTTWDQYVNFGGASTFDLTQVRAVTVALLPTPNTSMSIDGFGIAPTPGAAAGLLLGGMVALRRRR